MVKIFTTKNSKITWIEEPNYGTLPPAGQSPSQRVFTYPGWVRSIDLPFVNAIEGIEDIEDPDKLFAAWYQSQVDIEGEMELNMTGVTTLSYALKPWSNTSKSRAVEIVHVPSDTVFAIYGFVPSGLSLEVEEGELVRLTIPFIAQRLAKEDAAIAEEYGTRPEPSSVLKFSDVSLYKDGVQLTDWISFSLDVSYDVMRLRDANERYPHDVEFQRNLQIEGSITMPIDTELLNELVNSTTFTLELRGLPGNKKLTLEDCVWTEIPAKADVGDLEAYIDYSFRALNASVV